MSDPLNAAAINTTRPVSWEKFDEISMGSPNQEETKPKVAHEESIDIEDGRHSAAAEARLEIEDNQDRAAVVTPLPTNEIIADVSKLGQAPVVSVSQDYGLDVITKDNVILTPGGVELVNGRRLATIYPENSGCAWIVPPRYEPTCMPAILAAEGIALPGEDYITAMELITNDYRFRSFSTLYSRMIAGWMTMSVVILLVVLFTNTQGGVPVMIFCFVWIFMLFAGIVGCAIIRKQIRIGLRHCVHSANKILVKHNLVVGIEDKGQLSCHKVVIHFLWFKISDCLPDLERLIRIEASGGAVVFGGQAHAAPAKEMTKTEIADKALQLVLKYSQGYVKDTVKHRLIFPSRPTHGVSDYSPKHCRRQYCVCQYIDKKHFNRPPKKWMAIVLLMGLPGAGKTTLAQKLLCQLPSSILFNMDELAGRKVDNFNAHKSRKEFELAVRRHLEATPFHQTKTIIVDDIFYLKSMRRPFERMARAHGLQLIVVFLKVDFQTARARNKTRGNDQLPEETIRRIFEEMELSANCFPFTNFQDLVHKIEEAKRTEPKSSEESERQPPTLAEINEKALRRCVKLMIDEGADGKRLGMVKKKIWTKIKRAGVVLEEEEVKHLLRDEYRL